MPRPLGIISFDENVDFTGSYVMTVNFIAPRQGVDQQTLDRDHGVIVTNRFGGPLQDKQVSYRGAHSEAGADAISLNKQAAINGGPEIYADARSKIGMKEWASSSARFRSRSTMEGTPSPRRTACSTSNRSRSCR
jgi:hypothetical protein